jgi:hypothetical protein
VHGAAGQALSLNVTMKMDVTSHLMTHISRIFSNMIAPHHWKAPSIII